MIHELKIIFTFLKYQVRLGVLKRVIVTVICVHSLKKDLVSL